MKLTQKQLADFAGVSDAYICYLEQEKKSPPPYQTVLAIAQALKLDGDQLWKVAVKSREKNALERSRNKSKARRNRYAKLPSDEDSAQDDTIQEVSDSEINTFFELKEIQVTTFSLLQKLPKELTMDEKRLLYHALSTVQIFISGT